MSDAAREIYGRPAFQEAALRSERARIRWTIGALLVIAGVAIVRDVLVATSGVEIFVATIALAVLAIGFEIAMLAYVRRGEPGSAYWRLNTTAEALFPTLVIGVVISMPSIGPANGLTAPAIALYYLAVMLSIMRLRPALCLLSGGVCCLGYAGVVGVAYIAFEEAPPRAGTGVYVSHAMAMLVAGGVAAAVTQRVRGYLVSSIQEAEERQRSRVETRNTLIFGLAKLAEYRDTDTGAHLVRISEYAAVLGDALRDEFDEIDEAWIDTLRVASSLHDIGKVGIPDAVLKKAGRLTDDEREVIQQHTALGADALHAIRGRHGEDDLLEMSEAIAVAHHERWDGKGYPNGVAGDQIPLAARIISVADVYDALTSVRVYKPAMPHEQAAQIITEARGTQFDPAVVDAFVRQGETFDAIRRQHQG